MAGKIGIGIEISARGLKMLRLRKTGTCYQLLDWAFQPLSASRPLDDTEMDHCREFCRVHHLRGRHVVVGISGRDLNIRYTHAPTSAEQQRLIRMMELEVSQLAQHGAEEFVYDYCLIHPAGTPVTKEHTVMLALARDCYVEQVIQLLVDMGVRVHYVTPAVLGLYNAFVQWGTYRQDDLVGICDIGHENTGLVICHGPHLYFARNLGVGGALLTNALLEQAQGNWAKAQNYKHTLDITTCQGEDEQDSALQGAVRQLLSLIDSTRQFAQTQLKLPTLKFKHLALTGGSAYQQGLTSVLQDYLHCPVALWAPGEMLNYEPAELQERFQVEAAAWVTPLGLARMACDPAVLALQLTSKRQRQRQDFIHKRLFEYLAVVVAFLMLSMATVLRVRQKNVQQAAFRRLQREYKQISRIAADIQKLQRRNQKLRARLVGLQALIRPGSHLLLVLAILRQVLPTHVSLISLCSEKKQNGCPSFSIKGIVEEADQDVYTVLKNFQHRLRAHPLVKRCQGEDPQHDVDAGQLHFHLHLQLKPAGDLAPMSPPSADARRKNFTRH